MPELEWRLRTSADNIHRDDELAHSLHQDVIDKTKHVTLGTFLTTKRTLFTSGGIVGLIILLSLFQGTDITFQQVTEDLDPSDITGLFVRTAGNLTTYEEIGEEASEDIYGNPSVAIYGGAEEELELSQLGGVVNMNKQGSGSGKESTAKNTALSGSTATGSATSTEKIKEEDKTIIQNYFSKIYEQ